MGTYIYVKFKVNWLTYMSPLEWNFILGIYAAFRFLVSDSDSDTCYQNDDNRIHATWVQRLLI